MRNPGSPKQIFRSSLLLHGSMGLLSVVAIALSDQPLPLPGDAQGILVGFSLGIGIGCGVAWLSLLIQRWWTAARQLEEGLAALFEGCTAVEILILALLSSFAEELLFRGFLQPILGWFLTSILFGLAHWTGDRRLSAWPLIAILAGAALGALALWDLSGLPGAIGAHLAVNWIGLTRLSRTKPTFPPGPRVDSHPFRSDDVGNR